MTYTLHSPPEPIDGQPPLIIMHGLMGSKTNWKSLGKAIATRTGMEVMQLVFGFTWALVPPLSQIRVMNVFLSQRLLCTEI